MDSEKEKYILNYDVKEGKYEDIMNTLKVVEFSKRFSNWSRIILSCIRQVSFGNR